MKFGIALIGLLAACATSAVAVPSNGFERREVSPEGLAMLKRELEQQAAGLSPRSPLEERTSCKGGYLSANQCIDNCAACSCTKGCTGICSYAGYFQNFVMSYECNCA